VRFCRAINLQFAKTYRRESLFYFWLGPRLRIVLCPATRTVQCTAVSEQDAVGITRREIITERGQSYVSRLRENIYPPTPLSARRVCPPPIEEGRLSNLTTLFYKAEVTHSPGGEGGGGSIFWKT